MRYRLLVLNREWLSGGLHYIGPRTRSHPAGVVSQEGMATQYATLQGARNAASRVYNTRKLTAFPVPFRDGTTDAPATERGDVFHTKKGT